METLACSVLDNQALTRLPSTCIMLWPLGTCRLQIQLRVTRNRINCHFLALMLFCFINKLSKLLYHCLSNIWKSSCIITLPLRLLIARQFRILFDFVQLKCLQGLIIIIIIIINSKATDEHFKSAAKAAA